MTKEQLYRKKFYKAVAYLEDCSEVTIHNECGVTMERGICLNDSDYITYHVEENTINVYVDYERVLSFDDESPIISMFEGLILSINEE
ncbi:hypothetical protein ACSXBY_03540 [Clostridium perfringens]|uniref:hypothetical protein n=1 Tax=Clostridium perfringens TaxID=1502 RepID=UPI002859F9E2|nr:hypothetical protein [Clostridium perfringens]ELC8402541.1 hypothetical protein [Clostridium perfringens]ELC8449231.1 hypothetical protein [Clostridium perfringens]MDV5112708.1 hypothetical protein [Clostridium perfringens]